MSLKEQIFESADVEEVTAHIDKWNADILFRGMSYDAYTVLAEGTDVSAALSGDKNQMVRLIAATACDPETGELLFSTPDDIRRLKQRSGEAIEECMTKGVSEVLGLGDVAGKDSTTPEAEESPTD